MTPALRPVTHAKPVFVDSSGKRRRWIRRGSVAVVTITTAYGVVVALSFLGGPVPPNALLPLPGIPGATTRPGGATSPAVAGGGASGSASSRPGTATPRAGAGPSASPKPSASASAGASPSSTRRVPPGLAGKSASPGSGNGHGH